VIGQEGKHGDDGGGDMEHGCMRHLSGGERVRCEGGMVMWHRKVTRRQRRGCGGRHSGDNNDTGGSDMGTGVMKREEEVKRRCDMKQEWDTHGRR
jgi:hypothetical protein